MRTYRVKLFIKKGLGIPKNRIDFYKGPKDFAVMINENLGHMPATKMLDLIVYLNVTVPKLYRLRIVSIDNLLEVNRL